MVRLFFTNLYEEAYGDDWDDVPFADNKGRVYDNFVTEVTDIAIPFTYEVMFLEEITNEYNWEQVKAAKMPVLIIVTMSETLPRKNEHDFIEFAFNNFSLNLGDKQEVVKRKIAKFNLKHKYKIKIM